MTKSTITREKAQWLHDACEEAAAAGIKLTMNPSELLMFTSYALAAMDSEPYGFTDGDRRGMIYKPEHADRLNEPVPVYRHAQPATVTEREPIAWLNDAYLARGVVDGEAGSEDAGPGYIPVYREAGPQPAPVVSDDLLSMAASAIEDLLEHTDPNTSYYSGVWADVPGKLRATMLQAGNCRENANSSTNNCREIPETSTNRSREHFISLCNEFWNWSEMDEVCAEDRGYELRMEWDGKVFKHPVTQALWRMYQATPQEVK
ncbi:TPA: hypothetical protein NPP74_004161 [Klebsiella quasipneumoniae subsp. similipneumoniae]|nr:hypothetical protein [Klebsiella quasipneumoniae subsp. similipneumoniae]